MLRTEQPPITSHQEQITIVPQLSIIIVNYNVKYFLEQALHSVYKALEKVEAEVFVVDNNSVDGSVEMVKEKFPQATLIANKENTGFAVANNQAIRLAKGKYVLLLNPDTVVEEDTFEKCLHFMDAHPEAGGLGVKMLDGKGKFLPESKRAFPTPAVAFYKAFGLSAIFPKSKTFGRYHLGFLDENETHEVEVLAGAFMLIRKKVLDEIGLLDETFFMYGEDIDLAYRIVEAGYKNYYFPETRIIHYKGESTKKGSLNYVKMFYQAMKIFAQKHFSGKQVKLFSALINFAIYLRAFIALSSRFVKKIHLPLLDAATIYGGMFFIKNFWEQNIKWFRGTEYPDEYLFINMPLYTLIWVGAVFFSGGYDKPLRISKIIRGLLVGTLIIAAIYGFMEEGLRFSRGMILSGAVWATIATVAIRVTFHFLKHKKFLFGEGQEKRVVIVGREEEAKRVRQMLGLIGERKNLIGFVRTDDTPFEGNHVLGGISQLHEIINIYEIEEVIFCGKDVAAQDIIDWMVKLGDRFDFKIVPQEGLSIIGSNSKNTAGDLYSVELQLNITTAANRRNKRLLDLLFSLWLLLLLPINFFMIKKPFKMLVNIIKVMAGRCSWVGYEKTDEMNEEIHLPRLRKGVVSPIDALKNKDLSPETVARLNLLYAKDYTTSKDLNILWKAYGRLGN